MVKVPLNDIIEKKNPDAFANQVRIKNSLYDAQVQQQPLEVEKNEIYELNKHDDLNYRSSQANSSDQLAPQDTKSVKLSSVNIVEKNNSAASQQTLDPFKHSFSQTFDDRTEKCAKSIAYKSSTPSPPPEISSREPKTITTNTHTTKIKMKKSKKNTKIAESPFVTLQSEQASFNATNSEYENSDWAESSQNRSDEKNSFRNQKSKPKYSKNRLISFSATSRDSIQSPSPILSTQKNDLSSKNQSDKFLTNMTPAKENDESLVLNSNRTNEEDSSERILVEKDGVFKLMTTEEHTAYEEQKKKEAILNSHINKDSSLNSTLSSSTITSQKICPSAEVKIDSQSSVHSRPGNNQVKSESKKIQATSSIISRKSNSAFANRSDERSNRSNKESCLISLDTKRTNVRLSHSADPNSRAQHASKG